MDIRQASKDEALRAARLTVGGLPGSDARSAKALEAMGLDPRCHVVALDGNRMVGACLYVLGAGRAATVLPPVTRGFRGRAAEEQEVRVRLISAARQACRHAGAVLIQTFIEHAPQNSEARAFTESGFRPLSELIYLRAEVDRKTPEAAPLPAGLRVETFAPHLEPAFLHAIAATYEGSFDCPAVDGLRDPADVIASHKASGVFTPAAWFLVRQGDEPAAVVLVNLRQAQRVCELVYMGVAPAFRGRGLGRWLVARARQAARDMDCSQITVTVDAANVPALRLYSEAGFGQVGRLWAYYVPPQG